MFLLADLFSPFSLFFSLDSPFCPPFPYDFLTVPGFIRFLSPSIDPILIHFFSFVMCPPSLVIALIQPSNLSVAASFPASPLLTFISSFLLICFLSLYSPFFSFHFASQPAWSLATDCLSLSWHCSSSALLSFSLFLTFFPFSLILSVLPKSPTYAQKYRFLIILLFLFRFRVVFSWAWYQLSDLFFAFTLGFVFWFFLHFFHFFLILHLTLRFLSFHHLGTNIIFRAPGVLPPNYHPAYHRYSLAVIL